MDAARLKIVPGFVTLISPHEKRLMDKATQELASNLMSYTLAGDSIRAELDDSAIREGYGQDANTYPSVENTLKRVTDALRLSGLSSEDIRAVQGVVCAMMDPEPKTLVRGYYEDDGVALVSFSLRVRRVRPNISCRSILSIWKMPTIQYTPQDGRIVIRFFHLIIWMCARPSVKSALSMMGKC